MNRSNQHYKETLQPSFSLGSQKYAEGCNFNCHSNCSLSGVVKFRVVRYQK